MWLLVHFGNFDGHPWVIFFIDIIYLQCVMVKKGVIVTHEVLIKCFMLPPHPTLNMMLP
jgi:hypothetical protein